MKNLIKLLIVFIVITITTESFSQIVTVKAGLNLSSMFAKDDEKTYSDEFKLKPGFHLGGTVEFPMNEMISLETGLMLLTKGYKFSEKATDYEYKQKLSLFYIDIPITAKASFTAGDMKIYGIFGPYLGLGLAGKSKEEETGLIEDSQVIKIKWGSTADDDFKRLDYGLIAGAGVEINSIRIGLSYGLGLANISSYTGNGTKNSNRVLGISLGYTFERE